MKIIALKQQNVITPEELSNNSIIGVLVQRGKGAIIYDTEIRGCKIVLFTVNAGGTPSVCTASSRNLIEIVNHFLACGEKMFHFETQKELLNWLAE